MANWGISCSPNVSAASPVLSSQSSSVTSEFEGLYKVGNTSCAVTPIKMAFEIKWAKGRGVMIFFFDKITADGKVIFVSEKLDNGRDKFVFDDGRYKAGLFIRADGKVFTVKKLRD